ncbi:hypothetical protein K2Y00_02850 [Patescibacteria group bacterium]|nr:hypothetical protein [Patescibacteria group bacterium]
MVKGTPEFPESGGNTSKADLSTLEGFSRLSPAQQAMLRMLQGPHAEQGLVNCHLAVFYVERGASEAGDEGRHKELRDFQLLGYEISQDPTLDALTKQITKTGFPCIVAPSTVYDEAQPPEPVHTFIAFKNKQGEIVLWEKSGFDGGYQTRTLPEVYAAYQTGTDQVFWRTRKLKTR